MKRLLYLFGVVNSFIASAQPFPVKNVNDDYIITNLKGSEKFRTDVLKVAGDKNGLYWFHNYTHFSSFDGVHWEDYKFTNAAGKTVPVRINCIELTDDTTIWMATAEGLYSFDRHLKKIIPVKQAFPGITGMPLITNYIKKGLNDLFLMSMVKEGFYLFDWHTGKVKRVIIDSINKINVPYEFQSVTTDKLGKYWGLTREGKGIWCYNPTTGVLNCSWKGEIFRASTKHLENRNITMLTYSEKDNALLLSYGTEGILEKFYLSNGKSIFYSFTDDLKVRADTNSKKRHAILSLNVDSEKNEWVLTGGKYLVKLNADVSKFEYLVTDPNRFPIGEMDWLIDETKRNSDQKNNNILLWIFGERGLSVLKKRNELVRQIPFEKKSIEGITPNDYINRVLVNASLFKNIFFVRNIDDNYLLLQQNPGRPKLIRFDKELRITDALFNNKWKENPAYFNASIGSQNFYIAILRPGIEPLDFRNVVVKDFKVDLKTMKTEEVKLSFSQRIWRYGTADATNVYWLFSNGYLYSYNPQKNQLDSIFICGARAKEPYPSRIKGFDYPTFLHKNSSTFWISFIGNKELYKIDLKKRKIEKIFKSCLDQKDCLQSAVYQLYEFDSNRIYLKLNMSAALLNPANDSVTIYTDLFRDKLPYEDHVGALIYKDWLCSVTGSEINLQNQRTGQQKRLSFNKDFKWSLSEFSCAPLINKNGEMILMSSSQKGFVIFNLDSIAAPEVPGVVGFSFVRVNEKDLLLDSLLKVGSLRLKYNGYSSIHFRFSDYSLIDQDRIRYEYTLYNGNDTIWNKIEGNPEINFTRITPGKYKLLIRASNGFGNYSPGITAFNISIIPPFIQTTGFIVLLIGVVGVILYGIYFYRLKQIKKFQAIRNNIASDLHDDIGSTLNSISIYSEVAKQQAGKEIPALNLIGENSRKIIESMSDIVWTINPENDSMEKIIIRMRSFAHQLLKAKKVEYTFEVDDKMNKIVLPMQVRKNFYLVFKEAITNVVKYSEASRVSISLFEKNKIIMLRIRDNGKGIPINAEMQGNGLLNMGKRAAEIRAELNIISSNDSGTEIELTLDTFK